MSDMTKAQEAKIGAIYFALICGTVLGWKALDVSHPAPVAAPIVQYIPMGKPAPVDYSPATIPETSPDAEDILGATSYPDAKASKHRERKHKERSHKESSITSSTTTVAVHRFTSKPAPTKAERAKASKPETYKVPKGPAVGGVR